jgi:hypothetical protein
MGWKKQETPMVRAKSTSLFLNAAFSQQEDLFPTAKRIHDNLPFFERHPHRTNLKSVAPNVETLVGGFDLPTRPTKRLNGRVEIGTDLKAHSRCFILCPTSSVLQCDMAGGQCRRSARTPQLFNWAGTIMVNVGIKVRQVCTLVGLVAICGCAHQYLMTLRNGDQIFCLDKPKLQGTNYHFTDTTGGKVVIAQSRVRKIRPVSVETEEKPATSESPKSPSRPKKPKHWYFLWLA